MTNPRIPDTVTFIPTYDCTAACENCCFGSHPGIRQRIEINRLLHYIDQAAALGSVKLIVFTGGECFSLGEDLDRAVQRCTNHGIATRCVSNAYWARTEEAALERLRPLISAGLGELNVSTGDAHQQFVPAGNIVNAMRAATALGISAVVVVESMNTRKFTANALRQDPRWVDFAKPRVGRPLPLVFESPWMSMDPRDPVDQPDRKLTNRSNLVRRPGCDSILRTVVVTPDEQLGACCGLTREQTPELHVGSLRDHSMSDLVDTMTDDLVKMWVAVDGPDRIVAWAAEHDDSIEWEGRFAHHCDTCRFMYSDDRIRAVISEHWNEVVDDVIYRFAAITAGTPDASKSEQGS